MAFTFPPHQGVRRATMQVVISACAGILPYYTLLLLPTSSQHNIMWS